MFYTKMRESGHMVMVKMDMVTACMTCPLCNQLLNDATTICECLHTFCRKCIHEKIKEEEIEFCPVCNTYLGCSPLEKLRTDHNLQDLRANIFPSSRTGALTFEASPSITIHPRRKERSISSLVVSTQIILPYPGKNDVWKNLISDEKKSLDFHEGGDKRLKYQRLSSSSPKTLAEHAKNNKQAVKLAVGSLEASSAAIDGWGEGCIILGGRNSNTWKPANHVINSGNMRKSQKIIKKRNGGTALFPVCCEMEYTPKLKATEQTAKALDYDGGKKDAYPSTSAPFEPMSFHRGRPKKEQHVKSERAKHPMWFSLVASDDEGGSMPLPQIRSQFLRIKDGSIPISFLKKYLVKKLDLQSEAEVEIKLEGEALPTSLKMESLVALWLNVTEREERFGVAVGGSAKDFIPTLSYSRKHNIILTPFSSAF